MIKKLPNFKARIDTVKVICAWCKKEIDNEPGQEGMRYSVCKSCLSRFDIFPEKKEDDHSLSDDLNVKVIREKL